MSKKRRQHDPGEDCRISWNRAARIFHFASPPGSIWERQFDYMPQKLWEFSQTPYSQIDFSDLWYYLGDLTYCELQQDLFDYLFPVCLMDCHFTLLRDESCQHEFEFHRAMRNGNIFQKMMNEGQRVEVFEFFRDSFLERLDAGKLLGPIRPEHGNLGWIYRFNSLGMVMPRIDLIWKPWWEMETSGRAVAALEYCSGFMYLDGDNPLFPEWKGASPPIYGNDSMNFDTGWMPENLEFLKKELTVDFFESSLCMAVQKLHGHQDENVARQLVDDLPLCRDLIAARIEELPLLLAEAQPDQWTGRFEY